MLSPIDCFEKLITPAYIERNIEFLKPIYARLYQDIGRNIAYGQDFIKDIEVVKSFFRSAYDIKKSANLKNSEVLKLRNLLTETNIVSATVDSFRRVLITLIRSRSNINGIEPFVWLILGRTTLERIEELVASNELISERLLSVEVLATILNTDYLFFDITLNDILSPFELINPTRRKGTFDKGVFSTIAKELNLSMDFNPGSTNWLIDESEVKRNLKFSLPPGVKYPDFICKIKNIGFIGAHKEQNQGGGAQDNQAEDAKRVFLFNSEPYKEQTLELLNVEEIKAVIIYDSYSKELRTGRHWESIYKQVQNNNDCYLVNSVIAIELLKSC